MGSLGKSKRLCGEEEEETKSIEAGQIRAFPLPSSRRAREELFSLFRVLRLLSGLDFGLRLGLGRRAHLARAPLLPPAAAARERAPVLPTPTPSHPLLLLLLLLLPLLSLPLRGAGAPPWRRGRAAGAETAAEGSSRAGSWPSRASRPRPSGGGRARGPPSRRRSPWCFRWKAMGGAAASLWCPGWSSRGAGGRTRCLWLAGRCWRFEGEEREREEREVREWEFFFPRSFYLQKQNENIFFPSPKFRRRIFKARLLLQSFSCPFRGEATR